jgi:hypothetical protein
MLTLDRSLYRDRLGDPSSWAGDWSKPSPEEGDRFRAGHYPTGDEATRVRERMTGLESLIIGMAIRRHKSAFIAAVLCVSRESVDRRLRPLGLRNAPGRLGRTPALRTT